MKHFSIFLLVFLLVSLLMGCSDNTQEDGEQGKLTIYTSVYPIQYVVERIGGDTVRAKTIFPPGVDAHSYEPTAKGMVAIAKSDAFIYVGHEMEGFSDTLASAVEGENVMLFSLGENEALFSDSESNEHTDAAAEDHHHDHDPHIWLDPKRMILMAKIILDDLIEINPTDRLLYENNFASLQEDLTALDTEYRKTLQAKQNKKILVSHAAYGYWEERYGIEQIPISGLSSTSEPSQKDLVKIIKQAKGYQLHDIIFEQNTSNAVSEIIKDEIGAQARTIHNLGVLTEDDIERHEDYLSLMRKNLHVLDMVTN